MLNDSSLLCKLLMKNGLSLMLKPFTSTNKIRKFGKSHTRSKENGNYMYIYFLYKTKVMFCVWRVKYLWYLANSYIKNTLQSLLFL